MLASKPGVGGENEDIAPPNDGERQQNMIKAAVKRALEPVLAELKEVKKQVLKTKDQSILNIHVFRMFQWTQS